MADKITLDFENNTIIWDTDNQQGTETYIGLQEKKEAVLAAIGYEEIDFTPAIDDVNEFINGGISQEELIKRLNAFENE